MSIMYHRPKYAIAQKVRRGKGVAIPDAVRRAEANVEAMRGDLSLELAQKIDKMEALLAAAPAPSQVTPVYDLAEGLIAVAGACGLSGAAKAAHSLCELLDRMGAAERFDREPVMVHLQALRLLSQSDGLPDAASAQILDGLERVCSRYGAEPTA